MSHLFPSSAQWLDNGVTHIRVPPTSPAVSVDDLKTHLRIDTADEDTYLEGLLLAASDYASGFMARSILTTELTRQYDQEEQRPSLRSEYTGRLALALPYPPVSSVDSVVTIARDGTETSISADDYTLDTVSQPARILLHTTVTGRQIATLRIEYTAGYGDSPDDVPALIKQGIMMHAAYMYEHRGDCDSDTAAGLSGATGTYGRYRVVLA